MNTNTSTTHYPIDALVNNQEGNDSLIDAINSADAHTLDEMFRERVRRSPNKVAYSQYDQSKELWQSATWAEIANQVERWQVAFRASGLKKGDRVAICYQNSIEWVVFDQAALRLGLVVVPIYAADRADNIAFIIANSGAKLILFASAVMWHDVVASDEDVSCVKTVLVLKASAQKNIATEIEAPLVVLVEQWLPEQGQHFERGLAEPDDLASIVYTSGTTGRPKGVMLSHRNILSNAYEGMRSVALRLDDELLSFLPLSHTLERTIGYYAAIMSGSAVTFNRSIAQLADDLELLKPTVMISVPRIFERIQNKVVASLESSSALKRFIFKMTVEAGWHAFEYHQGIAAWHPRLLLHPVLDRLVAQGVRNKLGGQLKYVIVGGAPLSPDVAKMFISLGIPLLQGYGLTESSPVVSVNTVNQNRPNSIGLPLRGVEAKLMDNNELWVKGDNIMRGYWLNEAATDRTIVESDDGRWLRTGDCASIDNDGYIHIIGRIKDILVLANGEKVPPTDIESAIARNSLFSQSMVLGEGKSFLAALVVLNTKVLATLCEARGWNGDDLSNIKLQDHLLAEIAAQMTDFPGYATIRKIAICEQSWTFEDGLLTPTLKIKRPRIMAKYSAKIEALYEGHGVSTL